MPFIKLEILFKEYILIFKKLNKKDIFPWPLMLLIL